MMGPDRSTDAASWRAVRALVDAALELPASERVAFLERASADAAVRADAARWLSACEHVEQVGDFLAQPIVERAAPLLSIDRGLLDAEVASVGEVPSALRDALAGVYEIEREIGRGGMASVYLARDLRHRRRVAVKVLHPELAVALGAERFLREIEVTAGLTHPHILPLHASGEAAGRLYYVMPYVEGETLAQRLAREGRLSVDDVVRLVREIASALDHAHRHGVVHRDVKPQNILLVDGHAVVADFGVARAVGLARELAAPRADDAVATSARGGIDTLTAAGTSPGTPAYMAPEQARGGVAVDHRVDLYALGIVAYEALAGVHPFGGRAPDALLEAHRSEVPMPLAAQRGGLPPALAGLVMRLLAKDPAARPASADAVLRALDGMASSAGTPFRARRVMLAVAAAVPLAVGGAWRATHRSDDRRAVVAAGAAASVARRPPGFRAVAVLPFARGSGTAGDDYLIDGLTDEVARALARLPGVRVAGRTPSHALQARAATPQEIGRALGVDAFVGGAMSRAGDRLRVTTRLVSTADGTVLWDSVFESRARDAFALEDELAHAIVGALAPALDARAADARGAPTIDVRLGTADQEAYDLYLKGRYHWLRRGPANVTRAIAYFRQAIARDPTFARAHAGLAMAYGVLPLFVPDATDSLAALTMASAQRAAALDSTLADAQLALGNALELRLQLREGQARYRTAVALDPSSATAHHWLGINLLVLGHTNEALAELRHARELDPLAVMPATALATALLFARRFPEAAAESRRALALDSTFSFAIWSLGLAQALGGQPDSAVRTLERGTHLHPGYSRLSAALVFAYATAGRWADAARLRAQLRRPGGDPFGGPEAAVADLVFGDPEPLVRLLTTDTGQRRYIDVDLLGCNPLLDPLWADARFRAAMRRLSVEACPLVRPWPFRAAPGGG